MNGPGPGPGPEPVAAAGHAGAAEPAVVLEEELPDGRRLVVYADGREVVTGRAGPRPHPVAGWAWLGTRPDGATRRVVRTAAARPRVSAEAERRAVELLRSLLDDGQRADYDRTGGFWVPTPRGPVRLGELYALLHHPAEHPRVERVLCVVPRGYQALPRADIWSNLLLTLAVDPEAFFRVAVLRGVRSRALRGGEGRGSPGTRPR